MLRRPPRSTRTDPHFPYTTLFRSDLLPERRSAPVGDAFLAAAGREKALPFGAGQPFDVGLCIPMRLADDDRGFEIIPEMAVHHARHRPIARHVDQRGEIGRASFREGVSR